MSFQTIAQKNEVSLQFGAGASAMTGLRSFSTMISNPESNDFFDYSGDNSIDFLMVGLVNFGYEYTFRNRLSLRTELAFQQKGFKSVGFIYDLNSNNGTRRAEISARFNYLSIPLKIGYRSKGENYIVGRLGLLSAYSPMNTGIIKVEGWETQRNSENFEQFDLALSLEAEYYYKLTDLIGINSGLMLDYGLKNFGNSSFQLRNFGLALKAGLTWQFSKSKK